MHNDDKCGVIVNIDLSKLCKVVTTSAWVCEKPWGEVVCRKGSSFFVGDDLMFSVVDGDIKVDVSSVSWSYHKSPCAQVKQWLKLQNSFDTTKSPFLPISAYQSQMYESDGSPSLEPLQHWSSLWALPPSSCNDGCFVFCPSLSAPHCVFHVVSSSPWVCLNACYMWSMLHIPTSPPLPKCCLNRFLSTCSSIPPPPPPTIISSHLHHHHPALILCGLPASGKSSLSALLRPSWTVFCQDDFGGKKNRFLKALRECGEGVRVVIDRCGVSVMQRREIMEELRKLGFIRIFCVVMDISVEECIDRAKHRVGHTTLQPDDADRVINAMRHQQTQPLLNEGFHAIYKMTSSSSPNQMVETLNKL